MASLAGGAAAEGQRGAASPQGFGGAALLPWEPKAARDALGDSFRPPFGGLLSWLLRRSRRTILRSKV
jgi:hypothetical protein